jgi:hypothetical protein
MDIFEYVVGAIESDIKRRIREKTSGVAHYVVRSLKVLYIKAMFLSLGCLLIISGLLIIPFSLFFISEVSPIHKVLFGIWIGVSFLLSGIVIAYLGWKNLPKIVRHI